MTSYPSPRTPTSPQAQTPGTPGWRRVRFDADAPNPTIRFIPPTPLSPVIDDTVEDFSSEPALFDTPTAMHSSTRPGWPTRRTSVPTTPLAYEESDPYIRPDDYDGYEIDSRPIVISPPAYEHVWKDIYMANSAAYRLRTALLESKRVDDVLRRRIVSPRSWNDNIVFDRPCYPALTAASVSTPGSVFTSLPGFSGTTDPDFPTTALKSAHANLKEAFLLYSEQFDLRKEYFGRALVLEYRERGGSRSGVSSRDDSRERPDRGFSGGFVMPPGPRTPGGYGYEEPRNNYGYPKPGTLYGLDWAIETRRLRVMLVTNGDNGEDEAMLNEDSLLCLVEDVDGACDALESTRIIRNILVRLSRIQPNDGVGRISDSIDQLSTNLVEFARGQGFEIYNGVSPSPVDPVPPMRELDNSSPKPPPPAAPLYSNPGGSGFTERERSYAPVPERMYSNPNSTFSPPVKSASPAPTASSSHYRPANQSPGPYVNPNRLNDMTGSQTPYSGSSSQGATPNMGSMPLVRRTDPVEVLSDPNGLEELARKGLDAVDGFMQVLRQVDRTPRVFALPRGAGVPVESDWSLPAERDITNEISRVGKTPVGQDAVSFTHTATWLGIQPVTIRYLRAVESPSRIRRRLRRDIDTWRTLFHPNVHMFISCVMPRHGAFGLVMPVAGRERDTRPEVVHGDFRGVNLVVSEDDRVMVTGYGILTAIEKNQELGFPEWGLHWGDGRWMAPDYTRTTPLPKPEDEVPRTKDDTKRRVCVCMHSSRDLDIGCSVCWSVRLERGTGGGEQGTDSTAADKHRVHIQVEVGSGLGLAPGVLEPEPRCETKHEDRG
ncbi:Protein tyrosine kinase [Rhizoctonia solani]|uniref:Protein tyrosine kinase n=1 Tax=Rhizoctonia solani TaxID=456999 RepID=A0A8H7IAL1_9AGAM|nr:Protein tyrosine kinase [Rhizoctonia solani]